MNLHYRLQHSHDLRPRLAGAASKLAVENHFVDGVAEICALEICHIGELRRQQLLVLEVRAGLWTWFSCRSSCRSLSCRRCRRILVVVTQLNDWRQCSGRSCGSGSGSTGGGGGCRRRG